MQLSMSDHAHRPRTGLNPTRQGSRGLDGRGRGRGGGGSRSALTPPHASTHTHCCKLLSSTTNHAVPELPGVGKVKIMDDTIRTNRAPRRCLARCRNTVLSRPFPAYTRCWMWRPILPLALTSFRRSRHSCFMQGPAWCRVLSGAWCRSVDVRTLSSSRLIRDKCIASAEFHWPPPSPPPPERPCMLMTGAAAEQG